MIDNILRYGEDRMTPGIAIDIAIGKVKGIISKSAQRKIQKGFEALKKIVEKGDAVYGVNTGFGPLCTTIISKTKIKQLQNNILKSHSAGMGEDVSPFIVKIMMILKVHALSLGYSGISIETLNRILWHIENDIIPSVPNQGSVGASGDLVPLAHTFLPLIGLGKVYKNGKIYKTSDIFNEYKLNPIELNPKEGLALINGTQFMSAYGIYALSRFNNCLEYSDIIGAMSIESLLGSAKPFDERVHQLRPYSGCIHTAHRVKLMLEGSEILKSHINCGKVQDPYSLRCIPQIHGAARNAFLHLKETLLIEINSVTDNPIVFDENTVISGGNFHGEPIAIPFDYAAVAVAELGNISDRRVYLLLKGSADGLPKLLMKDVGINSGFMISQYTSAALVSENKSLCFPASADSIPTSLGQEDIVSMGSISVRKLNTILDNLEKILAVELTTASQAFDFRKPLKSSFILEKCHDAVRCEIDHADNDRVFANDLNTAHKIIKSGKLVDISYKTAEREEIDLKGKYYDIFDVY